MNESKEHIIKVACKQFLQKNFKEVTMNQLVKSTGLSKGAFYHYFESKEQLFLEVVEFFYTTVMKLHYENYSRESFYKFYHEYANEIKKASKEYLSLFRGNKSEEEFNLNYFVLSFDALKLFPAFRARMVEEQHKELKIWTDVISDARKNGEIKSVISDEQIAQLFIFTSDGVAMHMIMEGIKIEEMVTPFMELWDKLYEQIKV
jgi:TetR/AcrR family transcriptional regulator, transcriptional repressor for nem operon